MSELPTVKISGKDYVTVDTRVQEFHRLYSEGYIETEILSDINSNRIVVKATAYPMGSVMPNGDSKGSVSMFAYRKFVGHAQEMIGDGFINKSSALENCETSAVGRALGFLGIGLVGSIATVDEVEKAKDMSKAPELNKPTTEQRQQVSALMKELGIVYSPDSPHEWTEYCLAAIGVPNPLNRDQVTKMITYMEEDILEREAKRVSARDE